MALLFSKFHSRILTSRLSSRFSLPSIVPERRIMVKSERFPGYSLLFDFNKVRGASLFNKAKRNATVFYACCVPALHASQMIYGALPYHSVDGFTFFGAAIVALLHSAGMFINNTIGYIYLKDDQKSVKISYVDYWGRRADLDTTIDNICMFSDVSSRFDNPWCQKVRLLDSPKKFKLYLAEGHVLDDKEFNRVFGKMI